MSYLVVLFLPLKTQRTHSFLVSDMKISSMYAAYCGCSEGLNSTRGQLTLVSVDLVVARSAL